MAKKQMRLSQEFQYIKCGGSAFSQLFNYTRKNHFNTSNVEVPPEKAHLFGEPNQNFNTSNVEVPRIYPVVYGLRRVNFNTSNVEVPRICRLSRA